MTDINLGSVVEAVQDQVSSDLDDEAVILNMTKGVYYGLNPSGAKIWKLVQQPRLVREIRDVLLEEYEVDAKRCEADLIALLSQMADQGLIEVRDAQPA